MIGFFTTFLVAQQPHHYRERHFHKQSKVDYRLGRLIPD
jgi:hypothetical protein